MKAKPSLPSFADFFQGKKIFVTGHTGFKGSWLAVWLDMLGTKVTGFSLPHDIRDGEKLLSALQTAEPDLVFHLAAQSLVGASFRNPIETFSTNVMGTAYLLEAIRKVPSVKVCVVATSDKCYRNANRKGRAYGEEDALGGKDPYSASKAGQEMVALSYRDSFLENVSVSTVRSGNVLGGGDWGADRIFPDCIRALSQGKPVVLRNPSATRPWQFILDSLSGYLCLAVHQWLEPAAFAEGWNVGPDPDQSRTVAALSEAVIQSWGEGDWVSAKTPDPSGIGLKEAPYLMLDPSKAKQRLGWRSIYDWEETIRETTAWYKESFRNPRFDAVKFTQAQIEDYTKRAGEKKCWWT